MSLLLFSRLRRPVVAGRLFQFTTILLFASGPHAQAAEVSGTIVDRSGRAVPRAIVRTIDSAGAETNHVFADELGRFVLPGSDGPGCNPRLELQKIRRIELSEKEQQMVLHDNVMSILEGVRHRAPGRRPR